MLPRPAYTKGALAVALLLVCSSGFSEPERGSNADMSNAPRVTIDRPKPTFMLMERDKRVHGLKPFQDLVDKAPAGSVLKPPPG
ncbi:MAG: nitrous oxide reductase family maturation protein NosD, partial [Azonexus sp.]